MYKSIFLNYKNCRLLDERSVVPVSRGYRQGGFNGRPRCAVADEAPGRLGFGGPWPPLQENLRRDDVVRTPCPGPNDVLFRRRDDVESFARRAVSGPRFAGL